MKTIILSFIIMFATVYSYGQGTKTLVVYYSRSGNTEAVAKHIQAFTGGDIFKLETVKAYPEDYRQTTDVAREEFESNARPEIKGKVQNIEQYDTVFIGFPIWWGMYPMVVSTFLETYKLDGKTVIPFCTHEGSRQGDSFSAIKRSAPGSVHKQGFVVRGSQAAGSGADVEKWLQELSVSK